MPRSRQAALGLLLALPLLLAARTARAEVDAAACAALAGARVEAQDIGLATRGAVVATAAFVEDAANGRFCRLIGAIAPVDPAAPPIRFQLNLPAVWNGKALQIGGGGYDGALITAEAARFPDPAKPSPLRQGYAAFGSDSGHQTKPGEEMAAFAANAEALRNFAGDQLKKTHDAALSLIRRAYGQAPRRTYFQGASQGGHEGFLVVQRWPQDYDGVIAFHPVYDFATLQTDGVLIGQALYKTPGAWIPPDKANLVTRSVIGACDGLDGLGDGIVSNVQACSRVFDPARLRCPSGADSGPHCLSDAQLRLLALMARDLPLGVTLAGGVDRFGKWPVLEGAAFSGRFNPFGGTAAAPRPPGNGDSFLHQMGDQMVRHMVIRDPAYDSLTFDPVRNAPALQAVSALIDASDADISAFQKRGGKLLMLHGTVDMAVTPYNTIAYFDRLKTLFGEDGLASFVRFYMVPGFGHGDGVFQVGWDSLGALDAWVETGTAPVDQIATDTAPATAGRTRPLCDYPAYPRFKGFGDPRSAASFVCTRP